MTSETQASAGSVSLGHLLPTCLGYSAFAFLGLGIIWVLVVWLNSQVREDRRISFNSFDDEVSYARKRFDCRRGSTFRSSPGSPRLFKCVRGHAETVRFVVSESANSPTTVESAKVLWSDWQIDTVEEKHADRLQAVETVGFAAMRWAPDLEREVILTFLANERTVFLTQNIRIEYNVTLRPGVAERVLSVSPR